MTRASALVLGTAQWGMPYGIANASGPPSDAELRALVARAREAGVAALDTARAYGESEARIGALRDAIAGFEITTKLAPDVAPDGVAAAEAVARTHASVEASLRALRVRRLDALLLHRAAHRTTCGGAVWNALREERRAGRIGRRGVSAANPEEAWAALDDPEVEQVQVATSLLDQRLWRAGFFERARERGKLVHVRSVFLQGVAFLAPDALPPHLAPLRAPLERIAKWASMRGLSVPDAFLLFARGLGVPLVLGFERAAQVGEIVARRESVHAQMDAWSELAASTSLPGRPDLLDPSRWR